MKLKRNIVILEFLIPCLNFQNGKIVDAYHKDIFKFRWLIINGKKFLLASEMIENSLPSPRYSNYRLISEDQYNIIEWLNIIRI